ncbi:MAG: BamA/TamA family outer membrane protein, partial [Planctomycetota bacterium]
FPILGDPKHSQIRDVLFLDTGTVEENFSVTTYRASVGVGMRWHIRRMGPVPIAVDLGIPISRDGDDDRQLLSFTVGWSF